MVTIDKPAIAVIAFDSHLSASKLELDSVLTVKDRSEQGKFSVINFLFDWSGA